MKFFRIIYSLCEQFELMNAFAIFLAEVGLVGQVMKELYFALGGAHLKDHLYIF